VEDPDEVSECLSSIFGLAGLYIPKSDHEEHELDESRLRSEVGKTMRP
jgi:Bacterial self-protective colicin-like immunity